MRDDLIGFVLGALDVSEQENIRRRVEQDRELQRQVELVQRCLQPLQGLRGGVDPPAGLAWRTCEQLGLVYGSSNTTARCATSSWELLPRDSDQRQTDERHGGPEVGSVSRKSSWGTDRLEHSAELRQWTLADFVVAAGVCLAVACLFFPALSNSRWHAQLASCQNNMRQLGTALIDFSQASGGYFPVIPPSGNLSFAGVYAPKLVAKGLVHDGQLLHCPAKGSTLLVKIPPLQDIAAAQGPQLVSLHRTIGGDYAYTLGFVRRGHLYGIRNQGRWNVAILADAPLENLRNRSIGTHGPGQNVLFADGHVRFLAKRLRPGTRDDDLFFNVHGDVLAGAHADDTVLAPSYVSPLR